MRHKLIMAAADDRRVLKPLRPGRRAFFLLCLATLMLCTPLHAGEKPNLSEDVEAGLGYLLTLAPADGTVQDLDVDAVDSVVAFIRQAKEMAHFMPQERAGSNGSFAAYTVERPLQEVMRYAYNSRIPEGAVNASSIHYSQWKDVAGRGGDALEVWQLLDALQAPEMIRGVSRETISPDLHTGAYYEYDLQRTIIMYRQGATRVVISLSSQIGSSEVGRKGLIVGNHEDWNYLYTQDQGLNRTGLGWVKSRIYQFLSVCIFVEEESLPGTTKVGAFQWLGAGWAGFNMVESQHIRNGLERYAVQFKGMLESDKMPDPETLEHLSLALRQTDEHLLREKAYDVTRHIQAKVQEQGSSRDRQTIDGLDTRSYVEGMSKDEVVTVLMREYIKLSLGKETPLNTAFWVDIKANGVAQKPLS